MSEAEDSDTARRRYRPPYSSRDPVPTVQGYREFKAEQKSGLAYESQNSADTVEGHATASQREGRLEPGDVQHQDLRDTSEAVSGSNNLKQRRKAEKSKPRDGTERTVTDPVTHLPVTIHDFTDTDIKEVNEKVDNDSQQTGSHTQLEQLRQLLQSAPNSLREKPAVQELEHQGMRQTFPQQYQGTQAQSMELDRQIGTPFRFAGDLVAWMAVWLYGLTPSVAGSSAWTLTKFSLIYLAFRGAAHLAYVRYRKQKLKAWEDDIWEDRRLVELPKLNSAEPESALWFNNFVSYVWPVVNPDIFASLVDTLEDVMQASLPRLVRMVSIEDLGQGSEPLRILGIKCLPQGAASKSVSAKGNHNSERANTGHQSQTETQSGTTSAEPSSDKEFGGEKDDQTFSTGMQAEEGEFVNLEVAFAYRPSTSKRKLKDREKNAHLYLAFYLIAGLKLPVWVELEGLVGTMRLRMQLTPDPPFFALCTITFLGQPKVDLSCVPLVKRGLNIMDLPVISNFVQSAVDAAMAEYVAPKSLTLDLKSMLAGDDFKHDTVARGVLVVRIIRAYDFKEGDVAIPLIRKGSSDGYVSVGWAKFGKVLFSTRVIIEEMHPYFDETTHLIVGPQELDANEAVRLQLWDSDRMTADDDLGRIEVDLKEITNDTKSNGRMMERTDTFQAMRAGETMPGRLQWCVGYYPKVKLLDSQVAHKPPQPSITTVEQLKAYSFEQSAGKLRESNRDEKSETDQLKVQDFDERCTELITTSQPTQIYPSGVLSIQIHQITGLKLENLSRPRDEDGGEAEDAEEEDGEQLPDSYVTISINHQKVFKTRTKPRSSKPFFNAGTERFVRDWRSTTVFVTVRDARVHEDNPLLGIVYLPIGKILRQKSSSRFNDFYPLAGGIGYGRIRISVVFRSVAMQPVPQALGWEWGTLEVQPHVKCDESLPKELKRHKITFKTPLGKGKMYPSQGRFWASSDEHAEELDEGWAPRHNIPLRLPVRNRYSVPLCIEFRASALLGDNTVAYAVLWLQHIPDEEDVTISIPVFKGDLSRAKANVLPQEEMGEKLGNLKVSVRFWRGLGRWHGRLAKSSGHVMDMMEVLQCAYDQSLIDELVGDDDWLERRDGEANKAGTEETSSDSSDSDSESSDEKAEDGNKASDDAKEKKASKLKNTSGFLNELRGYKRHKDQLHRRHRGVMQWKGPRIFQSMKNRAEHTVERIGDVFEHRSRQPGIETEV